MVSFHQDNVYILFSDMEGMAKLFTPKYFDLIEKHIDHQDNMFQNVIKEQNGKGKIKTTSLDSIEELKKKYTNVENYIDSQLFLHL